MTEREWLRSWSPVAMLKHLHAGPNDRKVLLYASALCRRRPKLLTESLRVWRELIEQVAEGVLPEDRLTGPIFPEQEDAESESSHLSERAPIGDRADYGAIADVVFCNWQINEAESEQPAVPMRQVRRIRAIHASFLRDIMGNPFRTVGFDHSWRTDTAIGLARSMYESRDFSPMPILADALEDAGCDNADILSHCRGDGPHVRGCWVVDLVLGKS